MKLLQTEGFETRKNPYFVVIPVCIKALFPVCYWCE